MLGSGKRRRFRVLFLHGFAQSGDLVRDVLESKGFVDESSEIELVYMTAPHKKNKSYFKSFLLHTAPWLDLPYDDFATWGLGTERHLLENGFHGSQLSSFEVEEKIKSLTGNVGSDGLVEPSVDLVESIAVVRDFVFENGPFDGIAGVSEGGVMAGICVSLQERGVDIGLTSLKFFMSFLAPRLSQAVDMGLFQPGSISLPSWVFYALDDPMPKTDEFASAFKTTVVQSGSGGHDIPDLRANKDVKESLKSFLDGIIAETSRREKRINCESIKRAISSGMQKCQTGSDADSASDILVEFPSLLEPSQVDIVMMEEKPAEFARLKKASFAEISPPSCETKSEA